MIIEIRKAGFVNKGAELMMLSVVEQLEARYPGVRLVCAAQGPASPLPYEKRVRLGLWQKVQLQPQGIWLGDFSALVPGKLRESFGVIRERDIDVVLDAAGFAYSDQWGSRPLRELAQAVRRWKKHDTKVVLLPQAFGPFGTSKTRTLMRDVVASTDLIFAREETSYQHLTALVGEQGHVRVAPDFTNLLSGITPDDAEALKQKVCIVPNARMMDKTEQSVADNYLDFLSAAIGEVQNHGLDAFVLVHEGQADREIAERLASQHSGLSVRTETDALLIKGILGSCRGVIGSRFHALVSALCQGVPSVATSWSHKYEMLFADYGHPAGVVPVEPGSGGLQEALTCITSDDVNLALRASLNQHAERLKASSAGMWAEVFRVIDSG